MVRFILIMLCTLNSAVGERGAGIMKRYWLHVVVVAGLAALAVASWTPGKYIIRTSAGSSLEHSAAYLSVGLAIMLACRLRKLWAITGGLTAYAAVLELGQIFIPGRNADVHNYAASVAGVIIALAAAGTLRRLAQTGKSTGKSAQPTMTGP